jgi:hypothetical protein
MHFTSVGIRFDIRFDIGIGIGIDSPHHFQLTGASPWWSFSRASAWEC